MVPISAMSPPASGMMAPLPNCFSIAAIAADTAFIFSFTLDMVSPWLGMQGDLSDGTRGGCVRPPAHIDQLVSSSYCGRSEGSCPGPGRKLGSLLRILWRVRPDGARGGRAAVALPVRDAPRAGRA